MSVYTDRAGRRYWTKAWFNKRPFGEPSVEITPGQAAHFLEDRPDKDEWLKEFFPEQMGFYEKAMEMTRQQLAAQLQAVSPIKEQAGPQMSAAS